jgi:hypothetical protein
LLHENAPVSGAFFLDSAMLKCRQISGKGRLLNFFESLGEKKHFDFS